MKNSDEVIGERKLHKIANKHKFLITHNGDSGTGKLHALLDLLSKTILLTPFIITHRIHMKLSMKPINQSINTSLIKEKVQLKNMLMIKIISMNIQVTSRMHSMILKIATLTQIFK